jgi:hypothetical protein
MKLNIHQAIVFHFGGSVCLYLVLIFSLRGSQEPKANLVEFSKVIKIGLIAAAVTAFCYFPYTYNPYGMFPEEMITLRKLVENPSIQINNLSFMPNLCTAYLFVPFYLFMAMVSVFIGHDVVVAISVMWAFTALVSLLCLVQLSFLITESRWPAFVIIIMSFIHSIFYQHWRSDIIVSFLPTADRYAFAAMCLLPLALVHFMIHMRDEKTNVGMFVALIYLIVEIAFVHAKECLIMLGMICAFMMLAVCHGKAYSKQLKRCLVLVSVCVGVLVLYKLTNLSINPELKAFTAEMRLEAWTTLSQWVSQHGFVKAIYGGPVIGDSYIDGKNMLAIFFSPGLLFFYSAVLLMPAYILRAKSIYQLFLPLVLCLSALLTMWGTGKALIMMLVSSRYLFSLNFLFILCGLMVFAHAVYQAARPLKSPSTMSWKSYSYLFLVLASLLLVPSLRFMGLTANYTIFGRVQVDAIVFLSCCVLCFLKAKSLAAGRTTVKTFVWKQGLESIGSRAIISIILFSILGAAVVTNYKPPHYEGRTNPLLNLRSLRDYFEFEYSPSTFTGNTVFDLNRLAVAGYLNTSPAGVIGQYPLEVDPSTFQWIRSNIPVGSVWVSASTAKLLVYCNVYAPVYTYNGEFHGSLTLNDNFENRFRNELENGFWVKSILSHPPMLTSLIENYKVQYLLVEPNEYDDVKVLLHQWAGEKHFTYLKVVYDDRRHLVIRVSP